VSHTCHGFSTLNGVHQPGIGGDGSNVGSAVSGIAAEGRQRLLVALTPRTGSGEAGPGVWSVARTAAAHAARWRARVALTWHARAGHRRVGKRLKRGLPGPK
jgi:hypothetical protein